VQPNVVLCPKCRTQNTSSERFCRNCGARLCPKCHNIVPESSRYCPNCMAYFGSVQHGQRQQTIPIAVPASRAPDAMPHYICPQCGARVDGPTHMRCPKCGFLGDTRYSESQQQTTHAAPAAGNVAPLPIPPRPAMPASSPHVAEQQFRRDPATSPQNKCPNCGASVHPYSRICPNCGTRCGTGRQFSSAHSQATSALWETRGTPQVAMNPPSPAMAYPQGVMPQAPRGWMPPPAMAYPDVTIPPTPKEWISPPSRRRFPGGMLVAILAIIVVFVGFFAITSYITSHNTSEWSPPPSETTAVDSTPPVIQNVSASSITRTGAIISWKTDEPATSQVMYCEADKQCLYSSLDKELVTNHSVTLSDLKPATTYHITALSKDASENEAAADLQKELKTSAQADTTQEGLAVGNRAPDFTLKNLAGETVSLSQFRGKIVMVNFWATSCTPCVREMPYIQEVYQSGNYNLEVLAIASNSGENIQTVKSFRDNNGYTFRVLLDSQGATQTKYGVTSWPRTFFINTEGVIKYLQPTDSGFSSKTEIENILKSL